MDKYSLKAGVEMGSCSTAQWHALCVQLVLSHPHHRLEGDELIDVLNVDGTTDRVEATYSSGARTVTAVDPA
jgi:hypothetical protein